MMHKSNKVNYFVFRYFSLTISVFLFSSPILILLFPEEIIANGSEGFSFSDFIKLMLGGVFFIVINALVNKRVVLLKTNYKEISFTFQKKQVIKTWADVESITRLWIVAPPMYYIRFENEKRGYFFPTGILFFTLLFFVFDFSEMGDFIKEKRKEIPMLKRIRNQKLKDKLT